MDRTSNFFPDMPKLLYLATEDWAFCQHFLPMGRAARDAGFEVVVAARAGRDTDRIVREGFRFVPLPIKRGSLAPFELVGSLVRMRRIVMAERPDIVHCINIRMALLGGLAARAAGAKALVLAPTGLGHLWLKRGLFIRAAKRLTAWVIGHLLRRKGTHYLFENSEDPREFGLDPAGGDVTIVGGAGVDPVTFQPGPEPPSPPVKVALVARMIAPKGIAEAVASVRLARERGAPVELHLFGTPDPENPTSYTEADLRRWTAEPGIHWHGRSEDAAAVYRDHHVALLLSHREGLPKSLVEAAASGRAIVASDVVGCREVVRDGVEGLLVPLGDVEAAAWTLARLAGDPTLRAQMGRAGRARFEERGYTTVLPLTRASPLAHGA